MTTTKKPHRLVFPDVLESVLQKNEDGAAADDNDDDNASADAVSELFFELANAPEICYRINNVAAKEQQQQQQQDGDDDKDYLVFRQDVSACGEHTGGIIWETSYLLLQYLRALYRHRDDNATSSNPQQQQTKETSPAPPPPLGRVLELGAGVGFLGQCLAATVTEDCRSVMLTETAQVLVNLQANLDRNAPVLQRHQQQQQQTSTTSVVVSAHALDWTCYERDAAQAEGLAPHTIDTLISTDVLFAPHLVEPLLAAAAHLSHGDTVWYLCAQVRCAVSHALFRQTAPSHGFVAIEDVSSQVFGMPGCEWGRALECLVYRITRRR